MFSGIIETMGTVINLVTLDGCKQFTIKPGLAFTDIHIGDSIAVNGVCLTVTRFDQQTFQVTAVPETLRLTNLDLIKNNDNVNLERSLAANSRIGGHFVQGHIDGTGKILEINADNKSSAWLVKIACPEKLTQYMVSKGYIAIDGMSITVIDTANDWFTVTLIPHTQAATIAHTYRIGHQVNLEADMMGKYIHKIMLTQSAALHTQQEV